MAELALTHQIKLEHFTWLWFSDKEDLLFGFLIGESNKCLMRSKQIPRGDTLQGEFHHNFLVVVSFYNGGNGCRILDTEKQYVKGKVMNLK